MNSNQKTIDPALQQAMVGIVGLAKTLQIITLYKELLEEIEHENMRLLQPDKV